MHNGTARSFKQRREMDSDHHWEKKSQNGHLKESGRRRGTGAQGYAGVLEKRRKRKIKPGNEQPKISRVLGGGLRTERCQGYKNSAPGRVKGTTQKKNTCC